MGKMTIVILYVYCLCYTIDVKNDGNAIKCNGSMILLYLSSACF